MLPTFTAAEPATAHDSVRHWIRLSLPVGWCGSAIEEEDRTSWRDRLGPLRGDLRQFLLAYSAGLVATLAFIA